MSFFHILSLSVYSFRRDLNDAMAVYISEYYLACRFVIMTLRLFIMSHHNHDFETPWLLYVNREYFHFFRCSLNTFY